MVSYLPNTTYLILYIKFIQVLIISNKIFHKIIGNKHVLNRFDILLLYQTRPHSFPIHSLQKLIWFSFDIRTNNNDFISLKFEMIKKCYPRLLIHKWSRYVNIIALCNKNLENETNSLEDSTEILESVIINWIVFKHLTVVSFS